MKLRQFCTLSVLFFCFSAIAQTPYQALNWNQPTSYFSYLMRDVHSQYQDRRQKFNEALHSKALMQDYCKQVKIRYRSILGKMPASCNLNAEVTGVIKQKGFRVEKIVFQSTPGRYVTANFYIPDGNKKFPTVLEMCGHGLTGKNPWAIEPLLARNGIATLVVDPIGEGERWQLIDDKGQYATRGVTTEHTLVNAGCCVVGTSLAALQCWDNHCAIDYLMTRKDVDKDNIGAFGSSGGGTETAYLIGFDDRVKAATICSYFSSRERTLELMGPSDGCQHISGEGTAEIELEDFPLMMAPKPVLIMSGKYDFVDLWGALQGVNDLRKAYKVLGRSNAVDQIVVETGHGMGKEKRDKMVRWFKYWLCHADSLNIIDDESSTLTLADSYCTPKTQVDLSYKNALSIPEANLKEAESYADKRMAFIKSDSLTVKNKVMQLLGISMNNSPIKAQLNLKSINRGYVEYRYELIKNGEMPVPFIMYVPDNVSAKSSVEVVLDDGGKDHFLSTYENYQSYLSNGTILIAADLRGRGETEDPAFYNDAKYWNSEYRIAMTSLHIGRPLIGQRVIDLLTLTDFISKDPILKGRDINLKVNGLYGPCAIHAAYFDPRICDVEISGSIKSFTEFCSQPLQRNMFSNVVVGVLKYYDLNDLIKLCKAHIHYID